LFDQPGLKLSPLQKINHEYEKRLARNPGLLYLDHFISIVFPDCTTSEITNIVLNYMASGFEKGSMDFLRIV
jgi:hypothetical protein